jgi:hypothetical protein
MSHRSIEVLIGRLITDEAFRRAFLSSPYSVIGSFILTGHELTATEIMALTATPADLWQLVAEQVDCRLQKASLSSVGF